MLSSEDKILIKTRGNLKKISARRLITESPNKNWKEKHWKTFCECGEQPVRSNAVQEVVGHGHSELQMLYLQLIT